MNQPTDPQAAGADDGPLFDEATLATLEALEDVLLELEAHPGREGTIPQWEFCEGFMTGLLCMRSPVPEEEWLPVLLGGHEDDSLPLFDSAEQQTRFLMHWQARAQQLRALLDAHVGAWEQGGDSDPFMLNPALMDWRGMAAAARAGLMEGADEGLLTDAGADDAEVEDGADERPELPAYGQMWAMGFMAVTGLWAEDWTAPRNHELSEDWDDALDCVAALTADDTDTPSINLMLEDAPPSVSQQRLETVGEALFAVHDLYGMARLLGPRIEPVQAGPKIGRNEPCPCGSGKKYKQCCGA